MAGQDNELSWAELNKLTAEVLSDNGPGSPGWKPEGSETNRINDRFMAALRENNGKVLPGELADLPGLIITTTGAKSGNKRALPLAYHEVDGRLPIIASMGGAKRNPPWFHNLVKNPEVLVEKDGESFLANAVVTTGDDRDKLFQQICAVLPPFAEYQERTTRVIPVVELQRK
jgi:deazaflavin-dependent oxidoreductase (nitroreductase family)